MAEKKKYHSPSSDPAREAIRRRAPKNAANVLPSSLYKIAERYMAAFAAEAFSLDGTLYVPPAEVIITHRAWRRYTCPENCGACCYPYELVYLPEEFARFEREYPQQVVNFSPLTVEVQVGDKRFQRNVIRDTQEDHEGHRCRYLRLADARCSIHLQNPFHCAIELLRFSRRTRPNAGDVVYVGTQKFGRAWALKKASGERGALCEVIPPDVERIAEVESHINYVLHWMDYFEIPVLPALRNFRFVDSYLHKDVVFSRKWAGSRLKVPASSYNKGVIVEAPKLVQLRLGRGFMRIEADRVYEEVHTGRSEVDPEARPKVGVFRYL